MNHNNWSKMMEPFKRHIIGMSLTVYCVIESIVLWFIPKRLRYKDITGEIILITGAGSGIGREISLLFAEHDVRLVLLDVNVKGLEETQYLIKKKSQEKVDVCIYQCDVSDRTAVYAVAAKIKDEIGVVTILVNNAGVITGKKFWDCPDDMIQKTMDVNIMAHFWTCKAFLPDMKAANHGHIVCISSLGGFTCIPGMADYCASKYAVVGFEQTLRQELEAEGYTGVKTTVVAPSFASTGFVNGFRAPSFLSALPVEKVAKETVSGVLINQEVIIIPGWLILFLILEVIFPRTASRQVFKFTNLASSMNTFQGRKKI